VGRAIGISEQIIMARKLRIAAVSLAATAAVVVFALWAVYRAAQQVRPFYQQALELDPAALERGKEELESRATALYSDARQAGTWRALFTDEQINGWLALQLADRSTGRTGELTRAMREPRIAIAPNLLTLGFTTTQGGVDTVVSVDGSVFLTDEGDVAVRLMKVQAGTLPLPMALVADQIAAGCRQLSLPVLWTHDDGRPVAIIRIRNVDDSHSWRLTLDSIELNEGELYVAGHTDTAAAAGSDFKLKEFELRLSPGSDQSMLEIARRSSDGPAHTDQ
jgi:hypothetical protein